MWGLSRRRRNDSPGRHAPKPLWPVPMAAPAPARPAPAQPVPARAAVSPRDPAPAAAANAPASAANAPAAPADAPRVRADPASTRTLAAEVAELLASGQAWDPADLTPETHQPPSSQWGGDGGGTQEPVLAPVVELGFRDGSSVRLDPGGAAGRDLQRAARALVVPAPPT